MPIEFHCIECGRTLRVPDVAAGMGARCPDCGTIQTVTLPLPDFRDPQPVSFQPAEIRSAPESAGAQTEEGVNPYQSPPLSQTLPGPVYRGPLQRHLVAARVQGPATVLMLLAIMSLVLLAINLAMHLIMVVGDWQDGSWDVVLGVAVGAAGAALYVVMLFGSLQMRRLRNYALAVAAAVIAMLPCTNCCLLGIPCGIWALVVLLNPQVRAAFE